MGAFLWSDLDQDQWFKICLDHVHKRNRRIHSGHRFTGSFDVPWSRQILDHWSWSRSPQRNAPYVSWREWVIAEYCATSGRSRPWAKGRRVGDGGFVLLTLWTFLPSLISFFTQDKVERGDGPLGPLLQIRYWQPKLFDICKLQTTFRRKEYSGQPEYHSG